MDSVSPDGRVPLFGMLANVEGWRDARMTRLFQFYDTPPQQQEPPGSLRVWAWGKFDCG